MTPATDALAFLTADHAAVHQLFSRYEALVAEQAGGAARRQLATDICQALTAHETAEEELLYPAALDALEDDSTIAQALSEHDHARGLIQQISAPAADDSLDALVKRLAGVVTEHVRREEGGLFIRLVFTSLDLEALGRQIILRRNEMLMQLRQAG